MKREKLNSGILGSGVNLSDMDVDVFLVSMHRNLGFLKFVSFFMLCIMTTKSWQSLFVYAI
jgi:hypothetical protein